MQKYRTGEHRFKQFTDFQFQPSCTAETEGRTSLVIRVQETNLFIIYLYRLNRTVLDLRKARVDNLLTYVTAPSNHCDIRIPKLLLQLFCSEE